MARLSETTIVGPDPQKEEARILGIVAKIAFLKCCDNALLVPTKKYMEEFDNHISYFEWLDFNDPSDEYLYELNIHDEYKEYFIMGWVNYFEITDEMGKKIDHYIRVYQNELTNVFNRLAMMYPPK